MNNHTPNTPHNPEVNGQVHLNGATPSKPNLFQRLAAQWRAPKQSARGEGWQHDPIARPRDEENNPQQRDIVYFATPPGDEKPVADTPKAEYLAAIAKTHPIRAKLLHDFYDHSVRPLLTRYQDAVRDEREKLAGVNAEIERHNAGAETRCADVEEERDAKTLTDREAISALDTPLSDAHRDAAHKVSLTGGPYDPHNPVPEAVLRHNPRADEVVAGDFGIPYTPGDDKRRLPKWFLWFLTAGTGLIVGLSLAIVGTFLDADAIGEQPFVVLGAAIAGFIVAAGGGWAVKHFCRAAAERYYLAIYHDRGGRYWVPSLIVAIAVCTAIIGMDASIEFSGLLKAANLDAATGAGAQSLPLGLAYLVGMVITFGYVLTYAREGALDGRYYPCLNRIRTLQEVEFVARDKEIRSQPVVQDALHAIAVVHDVQRDKGVLEARVESDAAPFNAEISALNASKRMPEHELSLESRRRIQDAHDNWIGAHSQYIAQVMAVVAEIEPLKTVGTTTSHNPKSPRRSTKGGFWNWVRERLGGKPPATRNSLEGVLRD